MQEQRGAMLKDISRKLTMKKSFFVTQLEGFFNAISQEYQDLIHQKEVENSLLEEKIQKLEHDVANLVQIRHELQAEVSQKDALIERLENDAGRENNDPHYQKLLEENISLREQLRENRSDEVDALKAELKKMRSILTKGAGSYQDTLSQQQKERLIEEITKNLKK
jgi:predicted RNase H-like nuclease (RuvC/YqgF family)